MVSSAVIRYKTFGNVISNCLMAFTIIEKREADGKWRTRGGWGLGRCVGSSSLKAVASEKRLTDNRRNP